MKDEFSSRFLHLIMKILYWGTVPSYNINSSMFYQYHSQLIVGSDAWCHGVICPHFKTCLPLLRSTSPAPPGLTPRHPMLTLTCAITASPTMPWSMWYVPEQGTATWWRTDPVWRMSGRTGSMLHSPRNTRLWSRQRIKAPKNQKVETFAFKISEIHFV